MATFTLNEHRKAIILEDLKLITIDSNESERSVAVIGEVVKAVVQSLKDAGFQAFFKAQNIYYEDVKKDFITDFELYADHKLFHIIEAKGNTGLAGAKTQIKLQLLKTQCQSGCITDGFVWQFVELTSGEHLDFSGSPLFLETHLDVIFQKILATFSR